MRPRGELLKNVDLNMKGRFTIAAKFAAGGAMKTYMLTIKEGSNENTNWIRIKF
jgi:hypothetical protein